MIDFARFGGCANTPDTLFPLTLNIADDVSKSRAAKKIKSERTIYIEQIYFIIAIKYRRSFFVMPGKIGIWGILKTECLAPVVPRGVVLKNTDYNN